MREEEKIGTEIGLSLADLILYGEDRQQVARVLHEEAWRIMDDSGEVWPYEEMARVVGEVLRGGDDFGDGMLDVLGEIEAQQGLDGGLVERMVARSRAPVDDLEVREVVEEETTELSLEEVVLIVNSAYPDLWDDEIKSYLLTLVDDKVKIFSVDSVRELLMDMREELGEPEELDRDWWVAEEFNQVGTGVDTNDMVGMYFRELMKTPLLTAKQEIILAKQIEAKGVVSRWLGLGGIFGEESRARLAEVEGRGRLAREHMEEVRVSKHNDS